MTVAIIPPEIRFWPHVQRGSDDECWIWQAALSPAGYGRFNAGHRMVLAHRYAYERMVGPIPTGLSLDHLCRVPACVNPTHLEPVTNRENLLRGNTITARNAAKTHCPQGHEYSLENTATRQGQRHCRACNRAWTRRRRLAVA